MLKATLVASLLWGAYIGSGVGDLREGVKHINDSRQAAIEKAINQ